MEYEELYKDKTVGYYSNARDEMVARVPAGVKLALDVGCGDGAFGENLKNKRNCTVWGIEPDKNSVATASEKIDKVINGIFVDDMPELKGMKFDAIFFNDVLEHLVAPQEALQLCKGILSEQGYVIASIPNLRYLPVMTSLIRDRDFKYQKFGVMDETHLRFFTQKSMIRLFEESGYEVLSIEGINAIPPTGRKFFKRLLFSKQPDLQFPQFAIVSKLKK